MENCEKCSKLTNMFETVGRTYYRLDAEKVLCYRHWHQENRPKFVDKGEYNEIFSKQSIAKATAKKDEKHKAPKRIWHGL